MKYVFDTSAIIVLLEICGLRDQLMLFSLNNELYVPATVKEEYLRGAYVNEATFERLFKVVNVDLKKDLLPYFNYDSSCGEIWVISHACNHQGFCCVIDEEFGRGICKLFNVNITGAIGIIKEMRRQGVLSEDDTTFIKRAIKDSRFYLSKKLLDELEQ